MELHHDPCNLMSNPSLIKFLSTRRGNRHINKKKKKHKETKIIKNGKRKTTAVSKKKNIIFYVTHLRENKISRQERKGMAKQVLKSYTSMVRKFFQNGIGCFEALFVLFGFIGFLQQCKQVKSISSIVHVRAVQTSFLLPIAARRKEKKRT